MSEKVSSKTLKEQLITLARSRKQILSDKQKGESNNKKVWLHLQRDVFPLIIGDLVAHFRNFDTEEWFKENEEALLEYPPIKESRAMKFEDCLKFFIDKEVLAKLGFVDSEEKRLEALGKETDELLKVTDMDKLKKVLLDVKEQKKEKKQP